MMTLRKHFEEELELGAAKANTAVAQFLFHQATGARGPWERGCRDLLDEDPYAVERNRWRTRNSPISGLAAGSFSGFRVRGYRELSNASSAFSRSACSRSRLSSSMRARIAAKSSA